MFEALKMRGAQLVAAFAGLALAGCAVQPAPLPAPVAGGAPALWRLADADTTIYLFGTIHALPQGTNWRTPALEAALAQADELVTEIVLPENPAASAQAMMARGMGEGLPPILERVPAAKREALREAISASGIPIQAFDRMKTWAAMLTLAAIGFQRLGLNPELGVERGLTGTARERSKRLVGLETVEDQIGFFDGLSEGAQRALLASTADDPAETRQRLQEMVTAWRTGDLGAIERSFNAEAGMTGEVREVLLARRNARWAEWIEARMRRPGRVLVAVGAGHLVGPDSVQAALARRGLRVQRVQ